MAAGLLATIFSAGFKHALFHQRLLGFPKNSHPGRNESENPSGTLGRMAEKSLCIVSKCGTCACVCMHVCVGEIITQNETKYVPSLATLPTSSLNKYSTTLPQPYCLILAPAISSSAFLPGDKTGPLGGRLLLHPPKKGRLPAQATGYFPFRPCNYSCPKLNFHSSSTPLCSPPLSSFRREAVNLGELAVKIQVLTALP